MSSASREALCARCLSEREICLSDDTMDPRGPREVSWGVGTGLASAARSAPDTPGPRSSHVEERREAKRAFAISWLESRERGHGTGSKGPPSSQTNRPAAVGPA